MARVSRRAFIGMAAAISAAGAWANRLPVESTAVWNERRDLFAEGVASGDPDSGSVLLWTRYSAESSQRSAELHVEVAEDSSFNRVVAAASTEILASADWTCRVLVGGLKPLAGVLVSIHGQVWRTAVVSGERLPRRRNQMTRGR